MSGWIQAAMQQNTMIPIKNSNNAMSDQAAAQVNFLFFTRFKESVENFSKWRNSTLQYYVCSKITQFPSDQKWAYF